MMHMSMVLFGRWYQSVQITDDCYQSRDCTTLRQITDDHTLPVVTASCIIQNKFFYESQKVTRECPQILCILLGSYCYISFPLINANLTRLVNKIPIQQISRQLIFYRHLTHCIFPCFNCPPLTKFSACESLSADGLAHCLTF